MKIETVTSDAIVANTGTIVNVDVENLEINIGASATTTTFVGPFGTMTFTVDGTDAAEKLSNCSKIGVYLADKIAELCGDKAHAKQKVFNFITSIAEFHDLTGIVHTGGTVNTALVSTALS